ncbi:MAG: glycosyl hydrolase [Lachnospiraceae bacterium]|nr:glycosyl hydrolase [Lachnospiraceae bacterium]
MKTQIKVKEGDKALFNNHADFCIGTGRMGLALQEEYQKQLAYVQDIIGFKYIRGHGLFSDDMAIYQRRKGFDGVEHIEYNFTYLDRVMDNYLKLNIRPFLELGFMPEKMASGDQTVFYWKGNTTPPSDYEEWAKLVKTTLSHLIERYGIEEVKKWPIEVWNEPNLPGFWKGADMQEYFKLYRCTALAVKEVSCELKVGGPAICGVDDERWMREFLRFVQSLNVPLDFVTRHHYTSCQLQIDGHYSYIDLHKPSEAFAVLEKSREIVDSFSEFKGMDIHITEFNTSYVPNAPIHDTNLNAAYVAHMLSKLGDKHASYSYWTFGDVFEEMGVAYTPFSGGFGLVANGIIPKPTFWTFAFFKELKGEAVFKSENAVIVKTEDGSYKGCAWNPDFYCEGNELNINVSLPCTEGQNYSLLIKTVDEECCNPLKVWHDLGEVATPKEELNKLLRDAAKPQITTKLLQGKDSVAFDLLLTKNAIKYFELKAVTIKSDRGYSYERTMAQHVEL